MNKILNFVALSVLLSFSGCSVKESKPEDVVKEFIQLGKKGNDSVMELLTEEGKRTILGRLGLYYCMKPPSKDLAKCNKSANLITSGDKEQGMDSYYQLSINILPMAFKKVTDENLNTVVDENSATVSNKYFKFKLVKEDNEWKINSK